MIERPQPGREVHVPVSCQMLGRGTEITAAQNRAKERIEITQKRDQTGNVLGRPPMDDV